MALVDQEEYTLFYPTSITLAQDDRVRVNGHDYVVRRLFDVDLGGMTNGAWLAKVLNA
jgi:hypothetical protein